MSLISECTPLRIGLSPQSNNILETSRHLSVDRYQYLLIKMIEISSSTPSRFRRSLFQTTLSPLSRSISNVPEPARQCQRRHTCSNIRLRSFEVTSRTCCNLVYDPRARVGSENPAIVRAVYTEKMRKKMENLAIRGSYRNGYRFRTR